jgi:uncharacterized protein YcbX
VGRNTGARAGVQAGIVTGLWRYPVKSMAGEAGVPGNELRFRPNLVITPASRACAGVYGTTIRPGLVTVGDPVTIAAMT